MFNDRSHWDLNFLYCYVMQTHCHLGGTQFQSRMHGFGQNILQKCLMGGSATAYTLFECPQTLVFPLFLRFQGGNDYWFIKSYFSFQLFQLKPY